MQYLTTPPEVLTIFTRTNHKQVVGLNIKRREEETPEDLNFGAYVKVRIKVFPSTIAGQFEFAAWETFVNLLCTSYLPATAAPIFQTA